MNDLALEIFNLSRKIKGNGWITIVPSRNKSLTLRVEWYLDQRHGYQQTFNVEEIELANVDLLDEFVRGANRAIEPYLNNGEDL